jgi:hypothetical protein
MQEGRISVAAWPALTRAAYGTPEWAEWVLGEKEGIEHIRYAYENGINTFE